MQSELKRIKEIFGITLIYITHNHERPLKWLIGWPFFSKER